MSDRAYKLLAPVTLLLKLPRAFNIAQTKVASFLKNTWMEVSLASGSFARQSQRYRPYLWNNVARFSSKQKSFNNDKQGLKIDRFKNVCSR